MVPGGVAITILAGLFLAAVLAAASLRHAGGGGRGALGDSCAPPYDWEKDGL